MSWKMHLDLESEIAREEFDAAANALGFLHSQTSTGGNLCYFNSEVCVAIRFGIGDSINRTAREISLENSVTRNLKSTYQGFRCAATLIGSRFHIQYVSGDFVNDIYGGKVPYSPEVFAYIDQHWAEMEGKEKEFEKWFLGLIEELEDLVPELRERQKKKKSF